MKKIYVLLILAIVFSFQSCTEKDNTIDTVLDDVSSGAVLRTLSIISGEVPLGTEGAGFAVEVEEQDN